MHVPEHFALPPEHLERILDTVRSGTLVTCHEDGLHATLLPFHAERRDGELVLVTHVVRANPQARTPVTGDGLVILDVADAYVSPHWYPTFDGDPDVPTWDYITVHARGPVQLDHNPARALAAASELTRRIEGEDVLTAVGEESLTRQSRAIVAVTMAVTSLEGKAKMSQNRHPDDILGVIAALEGRDGTEELVTFLREVSLPHARRRYDLLAELRGRRHPRGRTAGGTPRPDYTPEP